MTRLQFVADTAQHATQAIAAALGVDVAMIDDQFHLVATSKTFLNKRGTDINKSFVRKVYETGSSVIPNPGHHEFCKGCKYESNCPETAEVIRTMKYDGEIIGVILMVTYTQSQKERILANTEVLLEFIGEMANLICKNIRLGEAMANEKLVTKQLQTTMDFLDDGIIMVDRYGTITQSNKSAQKMAGINKKDWINHSIREFLPFQVYDFLINQGRTLKRLEVPAQGSERDKYLVSADPIIVKEKVAGAVLHIEDMDQVHSQVYEYSQTQIRYSFNDIKGESPEIKAVVDYASQIAANDSTILIQGESGTGKELFARAIHNHSPRCNAPFIPINCAAIPEALLESELFGYTDGAFTGAKKGGKPGKFEMAGKGTIFLDEIGDMPLHMQAKLLRVLQEKIVERVGSVKPIPVKARVIAATNQNLESKEYLHKFRRDLFFRLSVMPLNIPPLRERKPDILLLAEYFLKKYAARFHSQVTGLNVKAREQLLIHPWPGNVRELENAIEYAVNMERSDLITKSSLPANVCQSVQLPPREKGLLGRLKEYERLIITQTLETHGNSVPGKKQAAKELGISLPTLYRRIKELGI